jgi:glucosamine--fructose-6-phosphate aminotransferase (isomerizing)
MGVRDEILEQPASARRFLEDEASAIERVAEEIRARSIDLVVVAARGTSDHAAVYAQYVFAVRHGLPVALATPSAVTQYGAQPRVERALVVGISQSGRSPDIVAVVAAARRGGALTLALTNEPGSPLATAAELLIDLLAGPERAVAATKTYVAELLALAGLSLAIRPDGADERALERLPETLAAALEAEPAAQGAATRRREMTRCVVLGRGFEYATAREWGLKMKELALVLADPYSSADFRHGPVALIEPGFPVLAVATSGAVLPDVRELLQRLRDEQGADLLAVTDDPSVVSLAADHLPVPPGVPEWLRPIVSIVPAQLFSYHLALARGLDPESPRGLGKVTLTR